MATTKKPRSAEGLTSLDEFLGEQGTRETFQAVGIKEVLALQIEQAMKEQKLSRKRLAETWARAAAKSAASSTRPTGNVTLATLQRAAEMLGRKVRLDLV